MGTVPIDTGTETQVFTYDNNGNALTYRGASLTWDGKQLASYSKGADTLSFSYDDNGLRLSKTHNNETTSYYYNGSVLMSLVKGNDTLLFSYDQGGNVISVNYNGTDYYYLRNGQGDIVKLIDGSGSTVVEYSYNSWGEQTGCAGTLSTTLGVLNPFRYRGYVYDEETGLYYLQSRYYDPDLCRFISADVLLSTGQGVLGCNAFAYCGNEPLKRKDYNGEDWIDTLIDTLDWILKTEENLITAKKDINSRVPLCISHGWAGNVSFGPFDDIQAICVSLDTSGNIAIQAQPIVLGVTTSSPGASIVTTRSIMFAPNIKELNDGGTAVGVSVFTPYYGVGGGFDLNRTEGSGKHYYGFTASAGIGAPSSELHLNTSITKTLININIYDIKIKHIQLLRGLIQDVRNK